MHECLVQLMQDDKQPIGYIDLIDKAQKAKVMALSAGEQNDHRHEETVVSLFLRQATTTPEAVAIDDTRQALTYRTLEQLSGTLAHWLTSQGVGAGTFVGIDTKPCCAFLVGALAIMRAGGAYVPIDPDLPPKRRQHILHEAAISIILDEPTINHIAKTHQPSDVADHSQPKGAAYMIYTSGTTGMPKGVVVSHEALTNLILFCVRRWPLAPESRIACHADLAFDASVEDLFPGSQLIIGAPVSRGYYCDLRIGRPIEAEDVHRIKRRMEEIIQAVMYEIEQSGFADEIRSGIVITGGGAALTNVAALIKDQSGYTVRVGSRRQGRQPHAELPRGAAQAPRGGRSRGRSGRRDGGRADQSDGQRLQRGCLGEGQAGQAAESGQDTQTAEDTPETFAYLDQDRLRIRQPEQGPGRYL